MNKNKNGFTLIELLVVIGIIAILGVTIGISSNTLVKNSKKNEYKSLMTELLNAASVYSELSDSNCSDRCNIEIQKLVSKGLINKNIYDKINPMYAADTKFVGTNIISVSKNNGEKEVKYVCSSNNSYNLTLNNIDDYTWGKC